MTSIIKRIDFDPEFQPLTFPVVLKRDFLEGAEKAAEIVARARKDAARIRKQAKEVLLQANLEKEEERKKGYETGREEGLLALSDKILEVGQAREKILQEAEPQIIQMVMEIAEKVIGRALKKGAIVDVVKNTITQAVGQKIVVRVHPSDLEILKEKESDLLSALNQNQSLAVKGDETMTAGGCIIETEAGVVDARLEVQLKAIRKALGL